MSLIPFRTKRSGGMEGVGLRERGRYVLRVGGGHALGGDGMSCPDGDAPDPHRPRWISLQLDHGLSSRHTVLSRRHFRRSPPSKQ